LKILFTHFYIIITYIDDVNKLLGTTKQ